MPLSLYAQTKAPNQSPYVDEHTDKLLKALAGVMDSSVNALLVEAIDQWLSKPEIQEKTEKHRLDELD
ncbi:hypothetical protein H6F93_08045 [Leptolyngbya sp. FACHB-671]|uniref:hypothetical protein n=1 Tax=Leptolyngbya sp. FACHB-671 TaxID=2692812 RepID=UPI00168801CE|nr:hypothetical protein [Leptolyngbya sp. FACHB-671]MBD2067481.1 hypothetical protein [Leptolyngbya sp. FACHB-671]